MGNCQAIDNATLMIQQPGGRVEKMYWPVAASEIMKTNPGHYVALLLTTTTVYNPHPPSTAATTAHTATATAGNAPVRVTRIKLLRPTDTLILGQVYRLISNEEVMKGLWAKKYAKMKKKKEIESGEQREMIKEKLGCEFELSAGRIRSNVDQKTTSEQVMKHDERRHRHNYKQRAETSSAAAAKSRAWQPSLRSISESTS